MTVKGPEAIDPAPTGVPVALAQWGGPQGRNEVEGGRQRLFCLAMQRRRSRRRKMAGAGRCGKAIETQSASGHTGLIEACVGARQADSDRNLILASYSSVEFEDTPTAAGPQKCSHHRRLPCPAGSTDAARARPLRPHHGLRRPRAPCCGGIRTLAKSAPADAAISVSHRIISCFPAARATAFASPVRLRRRRLIPPCTLGRRGGGSWRAQPGAETEAHCQPSERSSGHCWAPCRTRRIRTVSRVTW